MPDNLTIDASSASGADTTYLVKVDPGLTSNQISIANLLNSTSGNVGFTTSNIHTLGNTNRKFRGIYLSQEINANSLVINETAGTINFKSNVSANGFEIVNSTAEPALKSLFDLRIYANANSRGGAVVVTNSPLRLASFTTTDRDNHIISPANGDVILNITTNKIQVFADKVWTDLH
jgi:hypothetical protein